MINSINSQPITISSTTNTTPSPSVQSEDSTFSTISGYMSSATSAGAASYLFSDKLAGNIKDRYAIYQEGGSVGDKIGKTVLSGPRESITRMKTFGVGLAISGLISSITNGAEVLMGKKTGADAVGTVAADVFHGGLSAAAAVSVAGSAAFGLSLIAPAFTGTPLLATTMGLGMATAIGLDFLLKKVGVHHAIKESVSNMVDGKDN